MPFKCVDVETLYAKDKKLKPEDIKIIQEWLKKQPHLPKIEDSQIAVFLHGCYFSIEAAKTTIDNYFTNKDQYAELFYYLSKEALTNFLSVVFIGILPKKTSKGYGIILLKLLDTDPDKYNFYESVSVINMVSTLYMHQYGFERGGIVVLDAKGFSFANLAKFNVTAVKHGLEHLQQGAPLRLRGVHFINVAAVVDKAMIMAKPFIRRDVYKMVQFHSNLDTFYQHVPMDCFPEDYGGGLPSIKELAEKNLENLLKNYDFFEWHYLQKVDESKRIGGGKNSYGIEGTFKRLDID